MKKVFVLIFVLLLAITTVSATRPEGGAIIVDSLKYEPYPAESGSYTNVWIKVENYGKGEAEDVEFILEPKFPFSLDSNEEAERFIGSLDTGEEVVLEYKVRVDEDAVEGINELDFKFTSDGNSWITHTFDILVKTHDTMLTTQDVIVTPEEVAPGELFDASILLENLADSTLKDLRLELQLTQRDVLSTAVSYSELPFTPVDSTNVLMAKRLGPNEQKLFTYRLRVDPDTDPKVYRIPITLTYSDEIGNTTYEEEGIIAVVVSKKPDIMVNLDESDIYVEDSKGEVTVGVYNIGMSKIKFAVLEIKEGDGYEILSNKKLYLGNVDSDDYETGRYTLYVDKENPEINFLLKYKDDFNKEHADDITLNLQTYSNSKAREYGFISGSPIGTIIVVILVVGAGVFFYIRKKKKNKKRH
jgi:hypothetical protein